MTWLPKIFKRKQGFCGKNFVKSSTTFSKKDYTKIELGKNSSNHFAMKNFGKSFWRKKGKISGNHFEGK